jgi:hypothetical protein
MKPRASMDRTMQSRSRTSTIHQGEMQKQSNQQGKIPGGITVRRDIHAQLSDAQSNLNLTKYLDKLKSGSFPDNLLIVREPWDFAFSRVEVIKNNLIEGGRSCAAAWDEKIGGVTGNACGYTLTRESEALPRDRNVCTEPLPTKINSSRLFPASSHVLTPPHCRNNDCRDREHR